MTHFTCTLGFGLLMLRVRDGGGLPLRLAYTRPLSAVRLLRFDWIGKFCVIYFVIFFCVDGEREASSHAIRFRFVGKHPCR